MKVNGNQNNGTPLSSQESHTDQLSKKAVAKTEDLPLKGFDAAKTWHKLSNRLGQIDKTMVTWGLAMAASFSLLVAANIEIFNWDHLDTAPSALVTETIESADQIIAITPAKLPSSVLEKVEAVKKTAELKKPIIQPTVANTPKTILLLDKKEHEEVEISPLSNPFVSVFAKANFQTDGVVPEIGLDFKLLENYTAKRRDIYKIGVSSQFNYKTSETGKRKIHPHTFVNLEFTSLNKNTNKGWTSRAGYLLNPDGQLYQDTTIKVSLFRNINKHIKVGPEVIFTNNMKTAYPSISLILG